MPQLLSAIRPLYFACPTWLQNVLISAYGARLRVLRYGARQRSVYADLSQSQWQSADQLRSQQVELLTKTVTWAAEQVPFYRDRGLRPMTFRSPEDLLGLPVVRKEDLKQAGKRALADSFRHVKLQEVHTGGTTGLPLTIYCDRPTLQRNYAFFARFRDWAGAPIGARVAVFAGRPVVPPDQRKPPYWRSNWAANTKLFSSYHIGLDTVADYARELARFRPTMIDSYPSSLRPIAEYLIRTGMQAVRPRSIITSSETLSDETRKLIETAFGCPVFDHYGAAEMAAFIGQCERGRYHVNTEFGAVEILCDGRPARPGEAGEVVATGFINPVMPLIRYATGDLAVVGEDGCPCGRRFPVIDRLMGRMDDVIVTPDGRRVGRLDPIFKAVSTMSEARIVQDAVDHVRVEMVLAGPLSASESKTLLGELQVRLGPTMKVTLQAVTKIPRTGLGKLRTVVNLVTPPGVDKVNRA